MGRILLLDDELDMLENCRRILTRTGHECFVSNEPAEAIRLLESALPDLVITDLRMPSIDGLEIMRRAQELDPARPVIMLTAFATIESAVAAVKAGAFDYLAKPFTMDQLRLAAERALAQRNLVIENRNLREQLSGILGFENIIGSSPAIQRVIDFVRKAARSEANILVLGESGTGKELVARAIHANSPRAAGAFVPVDCAALPENLLESELFGHERGAFTGAIASKPGLLETAGGGTVFLDEIGEMPIGLQAKMLRAIQEREIRRVGGTQQVRIDVRILSATNRDLRALVAAGKFRDDLFYRIDVIDIVLPALRDRKSDIALLAQRFLERYRRSGEGSPRGFEPEAIAALEAYHWPGNVRELQNVIERACALTEGPALSVRDLPEKIRSPKSAAEAEHAKGSDGSNGDGDELSFKQAKAKWVEELEAKYLRDVLNRYHGNVSQAARAARMDRTTFHRLLNKHRIR
ncbi:MAG: sigma-54-dependent transcriptional regulator [Candidatus Binataceae bacterium]